MKNITLKTSIAAAAAIVMMASCNGGVGSSKLQEQVDSLTAQLEQQKEDLGIYEDCVDMMVNGLDSIAIQQGMLIGDNKGTDKASKDQIRERISNMANLMDQQKKRLGELEKRLSASKGENSKLAQTVEYLKQQIAQKDQQIVELQRIVSQQDFDIHQFKAEINRLASVSAEQSVQIAEQEVQLSNAEVAQNTAYYVMGTGSDLKKKDVLKGGSLLTKKKLNVDDMNTAAFTKIDIRTATEFAIPGNDVQLMSQHPQGSYTITYNKQAKTSTLKVTDMQAFWSLTRYLVIKH